MVIGALVRTAPHPGGGRVDRVLGDLLEGVRPPTASDLVSLDWTLEESLGDGGCRLEATTARMTADSRARLVVTQDLTLVDVGGRAVARGRSTWRGPVVTDSTAALLRRCDVATVPWGSHMRGRLNADEAFAAATRTFDGAIEVGAQDRSVQFRIYRGEVLEVASKTPNGPTFAVVASDLAWTRFRTGDRADFTARASSGDFGSRGSSFEYLRMFKAVVLLADHAAAQWREERDALRAVS